MNHFESPIQDYWMGLPATPSMEPLPGVGKLWELEEDYSYLQYLYPDICQKLLDVIHEECDRLEYNGSQMFDMYPDKVSLQFMARKIEKQCRENDPDLFSDDPGHLSELIEILLYHEILYRRNRYRTRKRLYF